MNTIGEQETVAITTGRKGQTSFRLAAVASVTLALLAVLIAWGADWGRPPALYSTGLHPTFRYVNSGWISPNDWQDLGAFSKELRAFVIVNQDELDLFEDGYISKVSRGNATTLGRIDFDNSVLLAAYYAWRPVKGDPLAVTDVVIQGDRATTLLALDDNAQGREYAYLYAPMVMVAVERSLFPLGEAVAFTFELTGHPSITLNATPNPG